MQPMTEYKIPSLKVILNGTPDKESNRKRANLIILAGILSSTLLITPFFILPVLFMVETCRQTKLADKKSVIK